MIEWTARPLVELSLTLAAAEDSIAEVGSLIELPSLTELAVGTVHEAHPK